MSTNIGSTDKAIQLLKIRRLIFERLTSDPTLIEGALHYLDATDKLRLGQAAAYGDLPAAGAGGGDMLKSTYDANLSNIVDNSEKLEGSSKAQVQDHTPKAHTHVEADITDFDTYISQTVTALQNILSNLDFAAGKRPKFDYAYFNPSSVPADIEGYLYYDAVAHRLKLRDNTEWLVIPSIGGGEVVDSIKKTGESPLTGDVTLSQGAGIILTQSGQDITVAASGGGSASAKGDYTYLVYKSGVYFYAEDWEGNVVYGGDASAGGVDGTKPLDVLQACQNALPIPEGGIISVRYDFTTLGVLTIDRSRVEIRSEPNVMGSASAEPYIQKIKFDSSTRVVRSCVIRGININEVEFYVNGHDVRYIYFWHCQIYAKSTGGQQGLRVTYGSGDGIADWIYFLYSYLFHHSQATGKAFLNIEDHGSDGAGPFFFIGCGYYVNYFNNAVFCKVSAGKSALPIVVNHCGFDIDGDDWIMFYKDGNGGFLQFQVEGGTFFEFGRYGYTDSGLLLYIASSTSDITVQGEFNGNRFGLTHSATLKLLDNNSVNWSSAPSGLIFVHNYRSGSLGSWSGGENADKTDFKCTQAGGQISGNLDNPSDPT